jgi:hypothetical protein
MAEDLVKRLRDIHAGDAVDVAGKLDDLCQEAADLIERQAASLAAKDAEIERRDAFIKELSNALIAIRPLGGSELFVKRFGKHYADPAYCKTAIVKDADARHEAMSGLVRHRRRAEQAERALAETRTELGETQLVLEQTERNAARVIAEAVEVMRPFAAQADVWPQIPDNQAMMTSNGEDLSALDMLMSDLRAARAFIAEHGSDSREGK